jgi:D-alanyl-lipoteichoic acid acyltransferase DltB (MBOAT superfamily)
MLFHSNLFLFLILPVSLFFFYFLEKFKRFYIKKVFFLIFISSIFYIYWSLEFYFLLIFSLLINYSISFFIAKKKKIFLYFGIIFNLFILLYFKYKNFFLENISMITNYNFDLTTLILPLGISFYTFQQISFLIDTYKKNIILFKLEEYWLFVTFFPQLIAGPIVFSNVFKKQLKNLNYTTNSKIFKIGITYLTIGLIKKILVADKLSIITDSIFVELSFGSIDTITAIIGLLSYSLQIYFDFSGYCDMALGLAIFFGIRLPINFNSPYQATNILDYWNRWHITLSNFIQNYLFKYISMPLARKAIVKNPSSSSLLFISSTLIPIFICFTLSGLWHGASWMFIIWGLYHSILIISYYLLKELTKINNFKFKLNRFSKILITHFFILISWIFFRSPNLEVALNMFASFSSDSFKLNILNKSNLKEIVTILILYMCVFYSPNSNKISKYIMIKKFKYLYLLFLLIFFYIIWNITSLNKNEFIYYQF